MVSSNSWLNPALAAMEMSQMVVQGMWDRDSQLLQLPHFTKDLAADCKKAGVNEIFDLLGMEVGCHKYGALKNRFFSRKLWPGNCVNAGAWPGRGQTCLF